MTDIRCWRCDRKLAELSEGSITINLVCTRCGAKNHLTLPLTAAVSNTETVQKSAG